MPHFAERICQLCHSLISLTIDFHLKLYLHIIHRIFRCAFGSRWKSASVGHIRVEFLTNRIFWPKFEKRASKIRNETTWGTIQVCKQIVRAPLVSKHVPISFPPKDMRACHPRLIVLHDLCPFSSHGIPPSYAATIHRLFRFLHFHKPKRITDFGREK